MDSSPPRCPATLEQAAKWGAESGFQAIEIACWPLEKAARRYAGFYLSRDVLKPFIH